MFTALVFVATLAILALLYGLFVSIKASANRIDKPQPIKARDNGGRYTKPYMRSEGK